MNIPFQYYIQKEILATKDIVLNELEFPKNQKVRLFSLENYTLKLNEQVFSKWLPEKNQSNLVRNLVIAGAVLLLLAVIPIPFLLIGGNAGIAIASTSIVLKTMLASVMAVGLASITSAYIIQLINSKRKTKEPAENTNIRYSHHSLYTDLYNSSKKNLGDEHDISPFHNNAWMLSQHRDSVHEDLSKAKTEEVSCVLK
jgi:hypothetical protein